MGNVAESAGNAPRALGAGTKRRREGIRHRGRRRFPDPPAQDSPESLPGDLRFRPPLLEGPEVLELEAPCSPLMLAFRNEGQKSGHLGALYTTGGGRPRPNPG